MHNIENKNVSEQLSESQFPRIEEIFQDRKEYRFAYSYDKVASFKELVDRIDGFAQSGIVLNIEEKSFFEKKLLSFMDEIILDLQDKKSDGSEKDKYWKLARILKNKPRLLTSYQELGIDDGKLKKIFETIRGFDVSVFKHKIHSSDQRNAYMTFILSLDTLSFEEYKIIITQLYSSFDGLFFSLGKHGIDSDLLEIESFGNYMNLLESMEKKFTYTVSSHYTKYLHIIEEQVPLFLSTFMDNQHLSHENLRKTLLGYYKFYGLLEFPSEVVRKKYKEVGNAIDEYVNSNQELLEEQFLRKHNEFEKHIVEDWADNTLKNLQDLIESANKEREELDLGKTYKFEKVDAGLLLRIDDLDDKYSETYKISPYLVQGSRSFLITHESGECKKIIDTELFFEKLEDVKLGQFLKEEFDKVTDNHESLSFFDIAPNTRYLDFLSSGDTVVSAMMLQIKLFKNTLGEKYGMKTSDHIMTDDFRSSFLSQVQEYYSKGERDFFIHICGHGGPYGLMFENEIDTYDYFVSLQNQYQDLNLTFFTPACFGGGFISGYMKFIQEYPDTTIKINIFTEAFDTTPNYLNTVRTHEWSDGVLNETKMMSTPITYLLHKYLLEGDTFGEAYRKADLESMRSGEANGEVILHEKPRKKGRKGRRRKKDENSSSYEYFSDIDKMMEYNNIA